MLIKPISKPKYFLIQQSCYLCYCQANSTFPCSLKFYQAKTIQIQIKSQKHETRRQSYCTQKLSLNSIRIDLNLHYRVQISSNHKQSQKSTKIELVIENIIQIQKQKYVIEIQTNDSKQMIKILQKYFNGIVWYSNMFTDKFTIINQSNNNKVQKENYQNEIIQEKGFRNISKSQNNHIQFKYVRNKQTFEKMYAKVIYIKSKSSSHSRTNIQRIIREIEFQNLATHKNIIKYSELYWEQSFCVLFYQDRLASNLQQYLNRVRRIDKSTIKWITHEVLTALVQLESRDIVHRNITSRAIFIVQTNHEWRILLGEFQHAVFRTELHQSNQLTKHKQADDGSLYGRLPFQFQNGSFPADIFCVGLLFYQLTFKRLLFSKHKDNNITFKYDEIDYSAHQFRLLSSSCVNFLKQLLTFNNSIRSQAWEALCHEYLTNKENDQNSIKSFPTVDPNFFYNTVGGFLCSKEFEDKSVDGQKECGQFMISMGEQSFKKFNLKQMNKMRHNTQENKSKSLKQSLTYYQVEISKKQIKQNRSSFCQLHAMEKQNKIKRQTGKENWKSHTLQAPLNNSQCSIEQISTFEWLIEDEIGITNQPRDISLMRPSWGKQSKSTIRHEPQYDDV